MEKLSLITYNINGIRAALRKGLLEWIMENPADIICLQEVKAEQNQVELEAIKSLGYDIFWNSAVKKGYSGVALLSKIKPLSVTIQTGFDLYDNEGRILEADYKDFLLYNIYFPSGSSGEHRQEIKMQFLEDVLPYLKQKAKEKPLIVGGDFNICHRAVDIHDPVRNAKSSGFLPEEREWMNKFFEAGFTDAFRHIHPERKDAYSWWSYRANARNNNKGWRIDYWAVSDTIKHKIRHCELLADAMHSDHCPVLLELSLKK